MLREYRDKKANLKILRFLLSAVLIVILFWQIGWAKIFQSLHQVDPLAILIALVLTLISIVLSAYKWQILIFTQGFSPSLKTLTSLYFIGLFFNNFLPTSIGGDIVRIYELGKKIGHQQYAAASVIAERIIAALSLGLLVVISLLLNYKMSQPFLQPILVFIVVCGLLFWLSKYSTISNSFLEKMSGQIALVVEPFTKNLASLLRLDFAFLRVMFYSILFHLTVILINLFLFQAIGAQVPLIYYFIFIPIILALSMLPISFNGLGIREAGYAYFFSKVGLPAAQAVAVSIYFFLVVSLISLIGGVLFAIQK
jgi:hypothetical protein